MKILSRGQTGLYRLRPLRRRDRGQRTDPMGSSDMWERLRFPYRLYSEYWYLVHVRISEPRTLPSITTHPRPRRSRTLTPRYSSSSSYSCGYRHTPAKLEVISLPSDRQGPMQVILRTCTPYYCKTPALRAPRLPPRPASTFVVLRTGTATSTVPMTRCIRSTPYRYSVFRT